MTDLERIIDRNMTNHRPDELTQGLMEIVRRDFHVCATAISQCPDGREKAVAYTKLEEALMWTMASLARGNYDDLGVIDQAGVNELSGHATGGSRVNL